MVRGERSGATDGAASLRFETNVRRADQRAMTDSPLALE